MKSEIEPIECSTRLCKIPAGGYGKLEASADAEALREQAGSGEIRAGTVRKDSLVQAELFSILCIFFLRALADLVFFKKCACSAARDSGPHFRRTREKN